MAAGGRSTYRAVVLQGSLQTLELGGQRVMALSHQHDTIKTKKEKKRKRKPSGSDAQNNLKTLGQLKEEVHHFS